MNKKVCMGVAALLLVGLLSLFCGTERQTVYAETWDNAYSFYTTYGNQAVFCPTSQTDGLIYCSTDGAIAKSGTKYRTIGWKMDIRNSYGVVLQTLYFKLGGAYLTNVNTVRESGHEYLLYSIPLSTIRSRMNQSARAAMEQADCSIALDACMTLVVNGTIKGSMDDNGNMTGKVYTTYAGIASAANWTKASKETLTSYFNKSVNGLFYSVTLNKESGIASVGGGGSYCYGTYVKISATPSDGCMFSHWSGSETVYSSDHGFYVNGNTSWTANGKSKSTTVVFHRNSFGTDSVTRQQTYTYGTTGQSFVNPGWSRQGYHQTGWAHTKGASSAQYSITSGVSSDWISNYCPSVNLYAVWVPNTYRLVFHGNGASGGSVAPITASYGKTAAMPGNGFAKPVPGCVFLGWSMSTNGAAGCYKEKEQVSVDLLAQNAGVLGQNNGTIHLYAVWDYEPEIDTDGLYYSLKDAQSGVITEAELAAKVQADDREDGQILYGVNADNSLKVVDYHPEDFTGCTSDAVISVTYEAIDSAGNRVERTIPVYIVDTVIKEQSAAVGKIRLIDMTYFEDENGNLISEEEGGLKNTSRWSCDDTFRTLLREVLQKANLPAVSPGV